MDQIEFLIDQAHEIFSDSSVFDVIDLPRQEAAEWLAEFYGPAADAGKVDQYMDILDRLRRR